MKIRWITSISPPDFAALYYHFAGPVLRACAARSDGARPADSAEYTSFSRAVRQ